MREEIVKMLLKSRDVYLSGEEIAQRLSISRAGVWKHIDVLKKMGCAIECKQNKGYRLTQMPDVLAPEILCAWDFSKTLEHVRVLHYEECGSTNDVAKQLAQKGEQGPCVVVSERQTGGRGRLGRPWTSDPGEGIYMSILLRPGIPLFDAPKISLIAGVAVSRAIEKVASVHPKVKWPNDVLIDSRKVCGILNEMSASTDAIEYLVVGIGINVNNRQFHGELMQKATSVRLEAGKEISRPQLLLAVINEFFSLYEGFEATMDFVPIAMEYSKNSAILGKQIEVVSYGNTESGVCIGFDKDGALVLQLRDGKKKRVVAGDVSIRGGSIYV